MFWGLFEQAGGSLNLYTDRYVDRQGVPTSLFQSINPVYIIFLAPLFAGLWTWLGKRGLEPSAPAKFGLALAQVGLSFLVFVWGARVAGVEAMTPVLFVFLIYLLQTTGELCLSPVGLSAMTRLAPLHLLTLFVGQFRAPHVLLQPAQAGVDVVDGPLQLAAGRGHLPFFAVHLVFPVIRQRDNMPVVYVEQT